MTHREEKIAEIMRRTEDMRGLSRAEADEYYLSLAVEIARACAGDGEVPVGCVIARDGRIISCGGNGREGSKNALHHAELDAINAACRSLGGWRLSGCELYVTLEPCLMCAGAIANARIRRVVYALKDANGGAMGSLFSLESYPLQFKPRAELCEKYTNEVQTMMREFFHALR